MNKDSSGDGTLDRIAKDGPFPGKDFGHAHDHVPDPEKVEHSGSSQVKETYITAKYPPPSLGLGQAMASGPHWTAAANDHAQAMTENEEAIKRQKEAHKQSFLARRKKEREQGEGQGPDKGRGWE